MLLGVPLRLVRIVSQRGTLIESLQPHLHHTNIMILSSVAFYLTTSRQTSHPRPYPIKKLENFLEVQQNNSQICIQEFLGDMDSNFTNMRAMEY